MTQLDIGDRLRTEASIHNFICYSVSLDPALFVFQPQMDGIECWDKAILVHAEYFPPYTVCHFFRRPCDPDDDLILLTWFYRPEMHKWVIHEAEVAGPSNTPEDQLYELRQRGLEMEARYEEAERREQVWQALTSGAPVRLEDLGTTSDRVRGIRRGVPVVDDSTCPVTEEMVEFARRAIDVGESSSGVLHWFHPGFSPATDQSVVSPEGLREAQEKKRLGTIEAYKDDKSIDALLGLWGFLKDEARVGTISLEGNPLWDEFKLAASRLQEAIAQTQAKADANLGLISEEEFMNDLEARSLDS